MPEADRQRFVANIGRETQRIQELVDRMMELAALEQQRRLPKVEPVSLRPLLEELAASAEASGAARGLRRARRGRHRLGRGRGLPAAPRPGQPAGQRARVLARRRHDPSRAAGQPRSVSLSVRDHGPASPTTPTNASSRSSIRSRARPPARRAPAWASPSSRRSPSCTMAA
jgi:hypothetical protein